MQHVYTPGLGANATGFMAARSFESHAKFFAPYLNAGDSVLDVGCGPGTITAGIAEQVFPGGVIGVDSAASQILIAEQAAARGIRNLSFQVADCYALPFADDSFDRVFSHALFEHLSEPVRGLSEIRRVVRPGGLVGICSPDWGGFVLSPPSSDVENAISAYTSLQNNNGGDVYAGRKLGQHLAAAGFDNVQMSARYECYPSCEVIAEYLALQLDRQGDSKSAGALRNWSRAAGVLFAQAWISATGQK
jgi:SAM-dependent methyltransferase